MFAFSVISLGMGVLWVVNTLVSQSFGRGNYARLRAVSCGRASGSRWPSLLLLLPVLPFVSGVFRVAGPRATT